MLKSYLSPGCVSLSLNTVFLDLIKLLIENVLDCIHNTLDGFCHPARNMLKAFSLFVCFFVFAAVA